LSRVTACSRRPTATARALPIRPRSTGIAADTAASTAGALTTRAAISKLRSGTATTTAGAATGAAGIVNATETSPACSRRPTATGG
jgi:hypothetical protein